MDVRALPLNRPRLTWLVLMAAITAQGALAVRPRAPTWFGWAPASGGAFEMVTIWGSSAVCVTACWLAAQPRVHGYLHLVQTDSRGPQASRRLVLGYVASAGVTAYGLVGLSMAAAPPLLGGDFDGPLTTFAISSATTLVSAVFWAALGVLIGHHVPPLAGAAVAGIVPFFLYVVGSLYLSSSPLGALALADGRAFDYAQPDPAGWVLRLSVWASAAVAVGASVIRMRRTGSWARWATSATAAATLLAGTALGPIPGAAAARCAGSEPVVCTDRAHAFVLPAYATAAHDALRALPEPARPSVVAQERSLAPPEDGSFVVVTPPVSGHHEPAAMLSRDPFTARLGDALFGASCADARADEARAFAVTTLQIWWRLRLDLPLDGSVYPGEANFAMVDFAPMRAHAVAFERMDAARRDAWLSTHLPRLAACSPGPVELP